MGMNLLSNRCIMFGISWKRYSSMCDTCEVGKYLLKRRLLKHGLIYEIWHNGQLDYNSSDYSDFLKMAQPVISKNKEH